MEESLSIPAAAVLYSGSWSRPGRSSSLGTGPPGCPPAASAAAAPEQAVPRDRSQVLAAAGVHLIQGGAALHSLQRQRQWRQGQAGERLCGWRALEAGDDSSGLAGSTLWCCHKPWCGMPPAAACLLQPGARRNHAVCGVLQHRIHQVYHLQYMRYSGGTVFQAGTDRQQANESSERPALLKAGTRPRTGEAGGEQGSAEPRT